ncbi:hypothetical protein MMIC_P1233 [Mariprofundus micogutta]|uniref:Uncharacterized protein n=1 Tax=Mariprofundus micogutta TaxID=1921010 RepID=A0A1L8CN64_9PROT|nr:hypothetical protein [Mariprofundus micogutta]GAV20269.1 hypothetical protein MMIC_P1233 [Mariprofundus micogutta]
MAYSKDLLILRDGQAVAGKVLKNEFKIKTSFGDVTVNKEKIAHLYLKQPDGTGFPATDELRTINGDDIKGQLVKTLTISFVLAANNQTERIHRDKIHSIVIFDALDADTEGYPKLS